MVTYVIEGKFDLGCMFPADAVEGWNALFNPDDEIMVVGDLWLNPVFSSFAHALNGDITLATRPNSDNPILSQFIHKGSTRLDFLGHATGGIKASVFPFFSRDGRIEVYPVGREGESCMLIADPSGLQITATLADDLAEYFDSGIDESTIVWRVALEQH